MRKTANLNLSLYEKDDKLAITAAENSLNHNMELIDAAFKNMSEELKAEIINELKAYINQQLLGGEW